MLSLPVFTAIFAAAAAAAQSSVVNLLVQDSDNGPNDLVASLVSADSSLTTYVMNCQPTLDSNDCGWGPGATFTVGSTTMDMVLTDVSFTWSAHCSYSTITATVAVCTNVIGGSEANDPGTETVTYDGGDNGSAPWAGITITAGLGNAVVASTTASDSTSATGSSSGVVNTAGSSASATAKDSQSGSVSGSVSGSATAQASSKSASTSASSSTSTGGMPQVTAASFALGGAAMLVAIAAL